MLDSVTERMLGNVGMVVPCETLSVLIVLFEPTQVRLCNREDAGDGGAL